VRSGLAVTFGAFIDILSTSCGSIRPGSVRSSNREQDLRKFRYRAFVRPTERSLSHDNYAAVSALKYRRR
jgi:hypothetical protein